MGVAMDIDEPREHQQVSGIKVAGPVSQLADDESSGETKVAPLQPAANEH
jgi:hypothetical protein